MPPSFARRATSRKPRKLHFMTALVELRRAYLPERSEKFTAPDARWKTVRLRPEIDAIITALQDRFRSNLGVDLTVSEVIAAALVIALPGLSARQFRA